MMLDTTRPRIRARHVPLELTNAAPRAAEASVAHRLDIDGLRAVAVLPVLAYHVGIHSIPGGFVGVDIFFVISGFLITQVLLQDIDGGRFSLIKFYERRVRRILPALLVVAAVTFLVCAKYSLPSELIDLSKSLIAAALSVSNIYFWQTGGYFTAPALTRPLLHSWSLAVEEQFYIFWPLCLWFGATFMKRHLLGATFVLLAVSFAFSAYGAFSSPEATFYLVHTRAWELLLGGSLALGALPKPLGSSARNILSLIGLLLIGVSVLTIHAEMPFPGLLAVPPCLGAFLIILAGRDGTSVAGRLLSWRPIVFIGVISYSIYLWHWPLTVFQHNYALLITGESDRIRKLTIIVCSIACGAISWRFIEQPFRFGSWRPTRPTLFRMAAVATSAVVLLGAIGWAEEGFPGRYSSRQLRIAEYLNYSHDGMFRTEQGCFIFDRGPQRWGHNCLAWDPGKPNYLLLGDSHTAELWPGLHTAYPEINFLQAAAANCFPVIDHALGEAGSCTRPIDDLFHNFLPAHRIDMVVLSARWKADYAERIAATLDWFRARNIPVTLMGPTVVYDSALPRLLLTADGSNDPNLLDQHWDHTLMQFDDQLSTLAAAHGATYVSMLRLLCSGYSCSSADAQGLPLLYDAEHFTAEGSELVGRKLRAQGVWTSERRLSSVSPTFSRHGGQDQFLYPPP
jgi:peptidoglycan/LPS O-acetylase OafA/YrhL